jgi:hypothetical protein
MKLRKENYNKQRLEGSVIFALKALTVSAFVAALLLTKVFSLETMFKRDSEIPEQRSKELEQAERVLDDRIRAIALRIQEMIILKELPVVRFYPLRTVIKVEDDVNCIEYDTFTFGNVVGNPGSPSKAYYLKNMKLCFAGAKLLKIESEFIEASLKRDEKNQITVVHSDPTASDPNEIVMETHFNKTGGQTIKLSELENTMSYPHRVAYKRDFYVNHLTNLVYHLRTSYEMHKKSAKNRDRDAVNFLRRRASN